MGWTEFNVRVDIVRIGDLACTPTSTQNTKYKNTIIIRREIKEKSNIEINRLIERERERECVCVCV